MKTYLRLQDFVDQYAALPLEGFLARFPRPFLVVSIVEPKMKSSDEPTLDGNLSVKNTTRRKFKEDPNLVFTYVAYVERTEEGESEAISVGRGTSNDIVVYHPSVSRNHAHILGDSPSGDFRIVDLGATYGTELDGVKLKPSVEYPLDDGCNVVLGKSARCGFFTAESFHAYLVRLRGD